MADKTKLNRSLRVYRSRDRRSSQILLQGLWLQNAGFLPGDYLSVSVQKNKITINIKEKYEA